MKLGTERSTSSRDLEAADAAAAEKSNESPAVSSCSKTYEPIQLLSWNVEELGGGTSEPMVRESVLIDAYAKLITGLDLDVVVLLDVRWGRKLQIRQGTLSDGSPYLYYEDAEEDTGPAELDRILKALGKADSAGGWKLLIPSGDDGVIYDHGSTVGIFYKTQDGLSVADQGLSQGWEEPVAGIGGLLAWVTFDVPGTDDAEPWQATVAAPLHVMANEDLPAPDESEEDGGPELVDLPEAFVLALSWSPEASGSELSSLRSRLGLSGRNLQEGTMLHRLYWEKLVEDNEFLIDNAIVLNRRNPWVQNEYMNWQALAYPEHPDELDEVSGVLTDQVVSRWGSAEHPPWIEELRVVDMVRATLAQESKVYAAAAEDGSGSGEATAGEASESGSASEASDALPEDGLLVDALKSFSELSPPLVEKIEEDGDDGGDEAIRKDEPAADVDEEAALDLSTSYDFIRRLSDHWPLLAKVRPYD